MIKLFRVSSKLSGFKELSSALSISLCLKNAGSVFFVLGKTIFNVGFVVVYPRLSKKCQNDLRVDIFLDNVRAEIWADIR